MNVPPSSHFIYIPVILVLGLVLGFILGAKATRDALALEQRRQADRDARRAKREAAAAATATATAVTAPDPNSSSPPERSGGKRNDEVGGGRSGSSGA